MVGKIVSAEKFETCKLSDIPDGRYEGIWGGYVVQAEINGARYRFTTTSGIRTPRAHCWIIIKDGEITVETGK